MTEEQKIERALMPTFKKKVLPGKVLILLGARRVGKTELLKQYLNEREENDYLVLNGEDQSTVDVLSQRTVSNYKRLVGNKKLLVIDEAQKILDIGLKLKLMVDELEGVSIVATGSSIFDLSQNMGEPLVGRENKLFLYPLAQMELSKTENLIETRERFEERLIFGGYPELLKYPDWEDKADYLESIVSAYLLKDILSFEGLKKSDKIIDLLRLIAFQMGKEVSLGELANNLKGISRNTVEHYLDLLSKVFVLYKLPGFSRNLRKEVTKSSRWYFYDNGIRNAILRNFSPLNLRADRGELWENYIMAERLKFCVYGRKRTNRYFWRTYDQQEIDLVEEEAGNLHGYEIKWSDKKRVKPPRAWSNAYPDAQFSVVNTGNYLDFIDA